MSRHHATLFVTQNPTLAKEQLLSDVHDAEIVPFDADTLSIGQVRKIIEVAFQTPGHFDYRLIIITAQSIAVEAQQALLKILEEPPVTTRFLIVLPDVASVLPTVLSRVQVSVLSDESASDSFANFLSASYKVRFELIATAAKQKDDTLFMSWYSGLVSYVACQTLPVSDQAALMFVLSYARARGASKKMLWEEVALTLPVTTGR